MKFGIMLPHSGALSSVEGIRLVATEAERLGFDSVWGHDHVTYDTDWFLHRASGLLNQCVGIDPNFYESLSTLTYVAGFTERVRLGTAIMVLPLRDPRVLARQAMTVQTLSGGRLLLGVGIGDYPADFRVMGIPYNQRVPLTEEYIQCLRAIFQVGQVTFHGATIFFEDAAYYPKVPRIPILMGGGIIYRPEPEPDSLFEHTLRRLARWCDGWIPEGNPPLIQEGIKRIRQMAAEYGRTNFEPEVVMYLAMYLGDDEAAARKVRYTLEKERGSVKRGMEEFFIGSTEGVVRRIEEYDQIGVTHLSIRCWAEDLDSFLGMMRTFAREVMPRFK